MKKTEKKLQYVEPITTVEYVAMEGFLCSSEVKKAQIPKGQIYIEETNAVKHDDLGATLWLN